MRKFRYSVEYLDIIPPLADKYHYAAKVRRFVEVVNGEEIEIQHNFGEDWGETRGEARKNLAETVEEWKQQNQ